MRRIISMGWRKELCSQYLPVIYSAMACKNLRRKKETGLLLKEAERYFLLNFAVKLNVSFPKHFWD